jgi:hypothetical protein
MPMPGLAGSDHRALQNVERSKQSGRSVPLVIMRLSCRQAGPQRKNRLRAATAQRERERESGIWRRFGGGSDRNRALLDNKGNSMHGMQIVQSRINTAYFVSC